MKTTVIITKSGQRVTTIPHALGDALKMKAGTKLEWTVISGNKLAIEKVA